MVNRVRIRTTIWVAAGLLMARGAWGTPVPRQAPASRRQDSVRLAWLRARMEGQREIRVRVNGDFVELTRPALLDSSIAHHGARFDQVEDRDTLPNPLPLSRVSVVRVRGTAISVPAMLVGGVALGVSVLGSTLLQNLIDSRNAADGSAVARVTLLAFGIGVVLGGAQSAFTHRWPTVYRR